MSNIQVLESQTPSLLEMRWSDGQKLVLRFLKDCVLTEFY